MNTELLCLKIKGIRKMLRLLLVVLLVLLTSYGNPLCGSWLVQKGFYIYSDPPSTEGKATDGHPAKISFATGLLTDGKTDCDVELIINQQEHVDVLRTRRTFSLVFDLIRDYNIDKVLLSSLQGIPANQSVIVSVAYRSQRSVNYKLLLQKEWNQTKNLVFPMKQVSARYIRIDIRPGNPYLKIPISEVAFYVNNPERSVTDRVDIQATNTLLEELNKEYVLVEKYGQYIAEDWPEKVKSDEQLIQEAKSEAEQLDFISLDPNLFDKYGGRKDGVSLKVTRFFRTQKVDGVWWLITPEGHRFVLVGVCGVYPSDWTYQTPLLNPDGSQRGVFQELPDPEEFPGAYSGYQDQKRVNFLVANLKRKYQEPFSEKIYQVGSQWLNIMRKRFIDWGFNANAKWSKQPDFVVPYTITFFPADAKRIKWAVDPYDPNFSNAIARGFEALLRKHWAKNLIEDPWLIGYTFENENGWDNKIIETMLGCGGDCHAKRAFIRFLAERYNNDLTKIKKLLKVQMVSFEDLVEIPIKFECVPIDIVKDFIRATSKLYYEKASKMIKEYDSNHLILGSGMTIGWRSSEEWEIGGIEFLDALSFDIYSQDISWIKRYEKYDKPILLLEFSFSTFGRGLRGHPFVLPSQKSRGLWYRYVVEQLAASPVMVGFGWFLCYDSSAAMRSLPDGENFNQGLLNVCDQPYYEMINEMKKTNHRIYEIHAGNLEPVDLEELGLDKTRNDS